MGFFRASPPWALYALAATAAVVAATVALQYRRNNTSPKGAAPNSNNNKSNQQDNKKTATTTSTTTARQTPASITTSKKQATTTATSKPNSTTTTAALSSATTKTPPLREIVLHDNNNNNNNNNQNASSSSSLSVRVLSANAVTIVHGSVTGATQKMAHDLQKRLREVLGSARTIQLARIDELDWWDELLNPDTDLDFHQKSSTAAPPLVLVLLPTYTGGSWTPIAQPLEAALQEIATDWRVAQHPLKSSGVQVAVLGLGSSAYANVEDGSNPTMGQPARQAIRAWQTLGAKCVVRLQVGDSAVGNHAWETYQSWAERIVHFLQKKKSSTQKNNNNKSRRNKNKTTTTAKMAVVAEEEPTTTGCCGGGQQSDDHNKEQEQHACSNNEKDCSCQATPKDNQTDTADAEEEATVASDDYDEDEDEENREPDVMDLEDIGDAVAAAASETGDQTPKEMVTPSQAKALKKEGYKLIGTHSAVKLCRWTKHQLRGRGGCYKHTFYGITSYQCMEATPSLACANKCVFCWRHHKNPVGKTWRWKTDDPYDIVAQAVDTHVHMIKEAKGIPGVKMDRWKEAHTVRHCALSLVGEPIMYPRIDELLGELHRRHISTFLVTNGQHPEAIESIRPITQLYVSVDAPTRESLIQIDRPLFRDAWERLRTSLCSLRTKGQRTVARLTVVKGWNSDEIEGYAELIALGQVGLVEVKGVTFCGKSDASNLNMSNTPWHHEVVELTRRLKDEIDRIRSRRRDSASPQDIPPRYELACEHKHSCSVLLARVDQFADENPDGSLTWKTWINYDKFNELAMKNAADPSFTFSVTDYTAETPSWALFGASEEGFDPTETRHRKKTKHPKYTKFDDRGVPTHDHNNNPLPEEERQALAFEMEQRYKELGATSVITEHRDGAKEIEDPSLMFRGLVVTK